MSASKGATLLRPEPGPETLKTTRWGGHRLAALRLSDGPTNTQIGESWEFSTLPGRVSRALEKPLDELLGAPLPFLAKLIDTALPLSLQVHPADSTDAPGKEEAWMILDAEPEAHLWAGLARGVTLPQLTEAAARARATKRDGAALFALLRAIPAIPGTIILVPAGTVHAIGGGVLLAEIQQPSDCTFRIYDYGSDRKLHVDAAIRTIQADAAPQIWTPEMSPQKLRGEHLDLEIFTAGRHSLKTHDDPRLVVSIRGNSQISGETLLKGDLGLLLPGAATLRVEADSIALVGGCQ